MSKIHVIHENDAWVEPLRAAFDEQGLPYEEASKTLGIPLGTVKSRINRGRLELAKRLLGRRGDLVGEA